ncbi:MAG: hypothetical protein QM756_33910 [Polyangiaceae bacterium]
MSSMQAVLDQVEAQTQRFRAHPLFGFLHETRTEPERGLVLAPALAHFVMTFADVYRFVLRSEPAGDEYQKLVNAHTYEDGGHWKWFLADLKKLGHDPRIHFSDALRFLWGEDTVQLRLLSYNICRLGIGASSIHKLVLVQCIEATGSVMLGSVAPLGQALRERTGQALTYFGPHHFETESDHTLEQEQVHSFVAGVELPQALCAELLGLVDATFALFSAVADEMTTFARRGRGIPYA